MLYDDIYKANIDALKNHDKVARSILSVLYGKLKLLAIEKQVKVLSDDDTLKVIMKTIKELDEEALGYEKANRPQDVENLRLQKNVISVYLPKMLSEDEIRNIIQTLPDKSLPNVMKHFKVTYPGKCDMGLVSKIAKEF